MVTFCPCCWKPSTSCSRGPEKKLVCIQVLQNPCLWISPTHCPLNSLNRNTTYIVLGSERKVQFLEPTVPLSLNPLFPRIVWVLQHAAHVLRATGKTMDLAVAGQLVPIRPISQLNVKGWWGEVWGEKNYRNFKDISSWRQAIQKKANWTRGQETLPTFAV